MGQCSALAVISSPHNTLTDTVNNARSVSFYPDIVELNEFSVGPLLRRQHLPQAKANRPSVRYASATIQVSLRLHGGEELNSSDS